MVVSHVTKMQTLPHPTFLEPYNCNKSTIDSDTSLSLGGGFTAFSRNHGYA